MSSESGYFRFGVGTSGKITEDVFDGKGWFTSGGQSQFPVRSVDAIRMTMTVGGSQQRQLDMGPLLKFPREIILAP